MSQDLTKKYPGTVVAAVSKGSKTFSEDFRAALDLASKEINKPLHEKIQDKVRAYGPAVSCCTPAGHLVEGTVIAVQPFGCQDILKDWPADENATIVVRDHETGNVSHRRPSYVTFIGHIGEGI